MITHTETHLGAHHSPDLFHVQHDTVRATSLALAGQTERAEKQLAKARRVLDPMSATISFFWKMVGVWFSCWNLPEAVRQWMRELSEKILARARSPNGLWGTLASHVRADLEQKAQTCADLFQRSSSCVEGRNGHLSLKHHALHQLSSRKLQALTVLHNYSARRADGTTAAERFYGTAPCDLFAWLLNRLSVPARPRARRRAA